MVLGTLVNGVTIEFVKAEDADLDEILVFVNQINQEWYSKIIPDIHGDIMSGWRNCCKLGMVERSTLTKTYTLVERYFL